nr:MAG TPA: hypothetical protein [Caudoviricetes sp.]
MKRLGFNLAPIRRVLSAFAAFAPTHFIVTL